ncbi:MAG: hypothetical protein JXJ22_04045 [Bacteroidales bacterium]|nr:hypothetical protein [Bacteroidales bacterium]
MRRICVIIILLLLISRISITNDIKFDHITSNDGLSSNTLSCIFQDSRGFIWFGTNAGLNRYDGYSIKEYKHDPDDSLSLVSNVIITIAEDDEGNLWIGTRGHGMSKFDRNTEKFIPFINLPDQPEGISNNLVKKILFDSHQNLWIGTWGGLDLYQKETNTFKHLRHNKDDKNSLYNNIVHSILEDSDGNLWIGTDGAGLNLYNREKKNFEFIPNNSGNDNFVGGFFDKPLFEDRKGNIWIGAEGEGLYRFDKKTRIFSLYRYLPDLKGLNNGIITSFFEDEFGNIWLGTDGGGINIFNPVSETFEYIMYDSKIANGISTDAIYCIYQDRAGTIWIGTYSGGVNYYNKVKYKFEHYTNDPNNSNSLSFKVVLDIFEDSKNRIWIGTSGGGVDIFNRSDNSFIHHKHHPDKPASISGNIITCINEDRDGNIWIGTYNEGVNLYNEKTHSFKNFRHDPNNPASIGHNNVWAVYDDNSGNIYFLLLGGGLDIYNKTSGIFSHFKNNPEDPSSISYNNLITIFEDSKNNLWIGTEGGGLNLMDRENLTFKRFTYNRQKKGSISHNDIRIIYEDSKGNLWIGTGDGLNKLNYEDFTFTVLRKENGLPDNSINGILEDEDGNLWITTNKGLSRYNPEQESFRNYDINDGLQGNEFNYTSQCKTSNGELYFGGMNGFNIINPSTIIDNSYIPPVVLTDFQINGKPVITIRTKEDNKTIYKSISEIRNIMLTYKQNVFGFEFAALNYINPGKNHYKYKLEGFENDWNKTDANKRYVSYTNLKGGEYIFKVIGSNSDNIWNTEGVSINITILPPFWKTLWFKILILLLLSVSVGSIILFRYNNIKNQKIKLEYLVEKQTSELRLNQQRLIEQSDQLNETNTMLEERQQQIEEQTEVLRSQSEDLISQAEYLETVNEHLETVNKSKDKLFSIIAHDLKSPFNTIFGFAELLQLKKDSLTEEKRNTYIANLYDSAKRVYMLLENLLQWSRSQTNRIKFEPRKFTIKEMIEDIGLLHKENLKRKNLQFIYTVEDSIELTADYEMIHGVVRNLLSNAIKFTPERGTITITVQQENNSIQFSLKDTGMGIPENIANNLFKLDKTFSTAGTNGEKGTGLGLTLCKDFVEKHGGKIWVESTIGKGSNFMFSIPILN